MQQPLALQPLQPVSNQPLQPTQPVVPINQPSPLVTPTPDLLDPPKSCKSISLLLILLAFLAGIMWLGNMAILLILKYSIASASHGLISTDFLSLIPGYGWFPIIFAIASGIYLFSAFKVKDGSKKSWLISLAIVLIVPIVLTIIINATLPLIYKANFQITNDTQEVIAGINGMASIFSSISLDYLVAVIILILLLISYKKFTLPATPLTAGKKTFLIITCAILILPSSFLLIQTYIQSTDTDHGLTQLSEQTDIHIYRPTRLPNNRVYATNFYLNNSPKHNLAGRTDYIRVAFDHSLNDMLYARNSPSLIVMNQVDVPTGFNFTNYVDSIFPSNTDTKQIAMPNAINNQATLIITNSETGNFQIKTVTFVTTDNILISLMSPQSSLEDLITIANSLE
ncbi:hypothetical protein KKE34_01825 [Patescibacteria group bacterium]|nr:hypothetical protein [Patescibacteria group bacterium]